MDLHAPRDGDLPLRRFTELVNQGLDKDAPPHTRELWRRIRDELLSEGTDSIKTFLEASIETIAKRLDDALNDAEGRMQDAH